MPDPTDSISHAQAAARTAAIDAIARLEYGGWCEAFDSIRDPEIDAPPPPYDEAADHPMRLTYERAAARIVDATGDALNQLVAALLPSEARLIAERDAALARVAELEVEAQADACAIDEARGDLNDALDRVAAAETARAALIESWESEANGHRLTGHFGIAEGLRIAIDGLREAGEPTRSRASAAGFFGYIPAVTRTGRGLEPADHHRVVQEPGPVAVWSDGPPEPPGRLIGYAAAFNDGGGWWVDTVRLDGSWDDAELRHHGWLSGGDQALVVELREVGE